MYRTQMQKDSAQWVCNSLYSVMIGFTLSTILFTGNYNNYNLNFTFLGIILISYYVLDWLSYNAILDYDRVQEHLEVLLTIIFVIMLGWILVLSNYLNSSNYKYFSYGSMIYIGLTTFFSYIRIYKAYKLANDPESDDNSFLKEFWIWNLDSLVRIIVLLFFIIYSYEDFNHQFEKLQKIFTIGFLAILITKFIRYQFLLLPLIRNESRNGQE